ncbi:hypothetical protein A9Q99_09830 [Gammaproteobacteria bacterium 45_16_T64]|nr:hypothetical protein A9Q99_09830 [Gammaproteobacteria bacterium 45_16_T64]
MAESFLLALPPQHSRTIKRTLQLPNNKRKKPKQARSIVTVDAILEAAAHILRNEGIEGLNTNKVAAIAGVSIGSLYQYFPNKGSLIAALIELHVEEELTELGAVIEQHNFLLTPELIESVISQFIDIHLRDLQYTRLLHEQVTYAESRQCLRDATQTLEVLLANMMVVIKNGTWGLDKATRKAFIVVNAIDSIVQRSIGDDREVINRESLIEELTALTLGCLEL